MVFDSQQGMAAFVAAFKGQAKRLPQPQRDRAFADFSHTPLASLDGETHNMGRAGRRGLQAAYSGVLLQLVPAQQQLAAGASLDRRWVA
jgi:hypothetical protein